MTMMLATLAAAASLSAQGTPATEPTAPKAVVGASTYVDIDGGVGYASNPNLIVGGTGRALVRASIRAVHSRSTARTNTSISAYGENITYLGRYGSQQLVSLSGHHDAAVNEKVRLFVDLNASLDRSGLLGTRLVSLTPVFDPNSPTLVLPVLPDAQGGFVTTGGRSYQFSAQGGAQIQLSTIESLTVRGGATHVMLRGTAFDTTYDVFLGSVAYDRQLNARASVGTVVTAQQTDYTGPSHMLVVTPQVTARLALSDNTDVSGAIGASFATVKDGLATRKSSGLAFNISLCRRGENDQLCATVGRDQQTATLAGPVSVTSAGLSYSKRLDAKQTIQLAASGNHYSSQSSSLIPASVIDASTYVSGSAGYTRQLGPRLYTGANVAARRLFRDGVDPKADVSGSVFLRIRLGDRG